MNPIDILGGIFGRRRKQQPPSHQSEPEPAPEPGDLQAEARRLEDLLNVGGSRRGGGSSYQPPRQQREPTRRNDPFGSSSSNNPFDEPAKVEPRISDDERAKTLIRAMLFVAKADGQLDAEEKSAILKHAGDDSRETMQFLREEFERSVDVREFAWSVPLGMEQQVYSMSLITIDLDSNAEANYLQDLAHGLRIPEDVTEQLHRRYGVPVGRRR